jgi:hypothetical protein
MKYEKFIDGEGDFAFKINFLAQAISDDETRPFLNYIRIEPETNGGGLVGVCTDGRHLHTTVFNSGSTDFWGLTPGFWRVLKTSPSSVWIARVDDKETGGWVYPNWQKVIPSGNVKYKTTFEGFTFTRGHDCNHDGLSVFIHEFPEITGINLDHVHALGTGVVWEVEWRGSEKTIKFTSGDMVAIIMPLNIS